MRWEFFAPGGPWGALWVAAPAAFFVALLGGLATRLGPWYEQLRKPSWQPPNWLFGPVWSVIFALITVSGVIAWRDAPSVWARETVVVLFALNAILNIFWSVLFFTLRRPDWAFFEVAPLWLSILLLIVAFWPFAPLAAVLLAPYLLWVGFAAYLNWTIVRLNAPFSARAR